MTPADHLRARFFDPPYHGWGVITGIPTGSERRARIALNLERLAAIEAAEPARIAAEAAQIEAYKMRETLSSEIRAMLW